jgi:thioredoxin-related protein
MKKWRPFLILVLMMQLFICASAQIDTTTPPYKRFPTVPPFHILLADSSTVFTKEGLKPGKAVLIMVFSPECSHCQHETEELVVHREELKNVQVVMVTFDMFSKMKNFISTYQLNDMPNVTVGKDLYNTLPAFYSMRNLPFLAMYRKNGELIQGFEGSMGITKIIEIFRQNKSL